MKISGMSLVASSVLAFVMAACEGSVESTPQVTTGGGGSGGPDCNESAGWVPVYMKVVNSTTTSEISGFKTQCDVFDAVAKENYVICHQKNPDLPVQIAEVACYDKASQLKQIRFDCADLEQGDDATFKTWMTGLSEDYYCVVSFTAAP